MLEQEDFYFLPTMILETLLKQQWRLLTYFKMHCTMKFLFTCERFKNEFRTSELVFHGAELIMKLTPAFIVVDFCSEIWCKSSYYALSCSNKGILKITKFVTKWDDYFWPRLNQALCFEAAWSLEKIVLRLKPNHH